MIREQAEIRHDLSAIYDDPITYGENPQGVSVRVDIPAEGVIKSDEDFNNEVRNNKELGRRAQLAYEAGHFIGVMRGSPSKIITYVGSELHHITGDKVKKAAIIGTGAIAAAGTVFLLQHEMRKQIKKRKKTK